jgi:hypothetical protein
MELSQKIQLVRTRIEKRFRQEDVVQGTGLTLLKLKSMETAGATDDVAWTKYREFVISQPARPIEDGSPRVTVAIKRFITPSSNPAVSELGRLIEEYMDLTDTRMSDLVEKMKTSPINIPLMLTGEMPADKTLRYVKRVPELLEFINSRLANIIALSNMLNGNDVKVDDTVEACPVVKVETKINMPSLPAVVPASVTVEQLLAAPNSSNNLTVALVNSVADEKLVLVSAN